MRVVLIGPTAPKFKGGIVHYTATLYQELVKQKHTVKLVSFKRSYPERFFPGASGRDLSRAYLKQDAEEALIDWANPLSYWQAFWQIWAFKPDKVVIQWWTWFWTIPFLGVLLPLKLFSKSKLVVIAHNPFDHEEALYKSWSSRLVLGLADRILVPNLQVKNDLQKNYPRKQIILAFHPLYDFFKELSEKQSLIKLKSPRLLFFGHVRPYKGLDLLIKAMVKLWMSGSMVNLVVAGEFWEAKAKYLNLIPSQFLSRVQVIDRYLKNEEVDSIYRAAEAVAIPYRSGSGSGPSKIALSYNIPLVATNVGDSPDLFRLGKIGVLVKEPSVSELAQGIKKLFDSPLRRFAPGIRAAKRELSWNGLVQKITNE